ncbi:MAG: leucine-rich repeat domain-containing protein [Dysgonamonadaceae bacterium]|nr:leucine-rich repeat domain-containing protein [Dysgonamonadaceae bacterium]
MKSLNFPQNLRTIEQATFYGCTGLTALSLPAGLTFISAEAFSGCSELTSIVFPANLTSISNQAFRGCGKITTIVNLNPVAINIVVSGGLGLDWDNTFSNYKSTVYVANSAVNLYKNSNGWQNFNIVGGGITFSVKANTAVGGKVAATSSGFFQDGKTFIVQAEANEGYEFTAFTNQNNETVSTDSKYVFELHKNTILTAHFVKTSYKTNTATTDVGVVINGVRWATRNVDAPGTFAASPTSKGKIYQWNNKKAWAATGAVTGQNYSTAPAPVGSFWIKANDPSPKDWRVPTLNEIKSLLNTDRVKNEWTTLNGVSGRRFTDKTTGASIFFRRVIPIGRVRRTTIRGIAATLTSCLSVATMPNGITRPNPTDILYVALPITKTTA